MLNNGYLDPFDYESFTTCESCLADKMTNSRFSRTRERGTELLELIHTDVCSPMSTHVRGGFLYFITFTDNFLRYGHVYLMKYKSETFENSENTRMRWRNKLERVLKSFDQIKVENT